MQKTKIVTDGSIHQGKKLAISAYVIKRGDEQLASDFEIFEPPNYQAEYAEARAIRMALNKALELGIEDIRIGTDNRNVADAIKDKTQLGRFGDIRMIKKEAQEANSFKVFHVPRDVVEEAHELCQVVEV